MRTAQFHTTQGEMVFELFEEDAPLSVRHFIKLTEKGFYNGLVFFQYVQEGFLKSGCPNNDGSGFSGYLIKSEVSGRRQEHDRGVLSLVCGRKNTVGSQFIVCLDRDMVQGFDRHHTCIGKMQNRGWETLFKLRRFDQILSVEIGEIDDSSEVDEDELYD